MRKHNTSRRRQGSSCQSSIFCFLLIITAVRSFTPSRKYATNLRVPLKPPNPTFDRIRNLDSIDSNLPLHTLYAEKNPSRRQERGLLQILNNEVGDLILDKLNEKKYGETSTGAQSSGSTGKRNGYQSATDGLSKFHRSMLSTMSKRQRCVTGRYPLKIKVEENPTKKWLRAGSSSVATSQMLVNGTSVDRSLASYDKFQWLEDDERTTLHEGHTLFSLELLAEINVKKPGYLNIMPASDAGFAAKREKEEAGVWKKQYRLTYDQRGTGDGDDDDEDEKGIGIHASSKRELLERMLEAEKERVWITGFSLTKQAGEVHFVDVETGTMGQINKHTASDIRWPNEVNTVPIQHHNKGFNTKDAGMEITEEDALLVSDGFLVPGRDNGGLYVVSRPGHERNEWRACLAGGNGVDGLLSKLETKKDSIENDSSVDEDGWFYHRSIWIDLTGDGRLSVLTARAKRPSLLKNSDGSNSNEQNDSSPLSTKAQLVWLERPQPDSYDKSTGTPLDKDGLVFDPFSPKHTPWKVRVLDEGPDVMFSVADMDTSDDTVEVFASQFFNKKLTLHSIQRGAVPKVVFRRTLDDRCGASFSSILANLDTSNNPPTRQVLDSGSTVPTLRLGDSFSHLLITSHECTFAEEKGSESKPFGHKVPEKHIHTEVRMGHGELAIDGGSLFSYRVPGGKDAWKKEPWTRSVIATGFHVEGHLGNMINPGAPGFCYTFYPTKDGPTASHGSLSRPLIGIAGDCAESAYILRPVDSKVGIDPCTNYAMMCEINCGSTVGSIGIGYEDFCYAPQQKNYAKIYVPCYEKDKVLVFALGNGQDDKSNDGW